LVIVLARNWWALVVRGLFGVLLGIAAFAWPRSFFAALVLLFGAYALVDGVFALVAALVGRPRGMPWWALLVEGLAGVAVGGITFAWPWITGLSLLYLIAAWAIVTGVFEIVAAIQLRKEIRGEWLLALSGVLSILFGVLLAAFPGAGEVAITWLIGAYAIVFGVLLIILGFELRSWLLREPIMRSSPSGEPTTAAAHGPANVIR
jgi:uncharacterized membrane protein HdeD (DUF308 family)